MNTLLWLALTTFTLFLTEAKACDGPWRYLGSPPWEVMCAIPDPGQPSRVLAGTYMDWEIPRSGGVWSCADSDTVWEYAGLAGHRVFSLSYYPYCRPNAFAATGDGYFMRTADTTWIRVGGIASTWVYESEFLISPEDTSLWLATSSDPDFGGFLKVSRNSGQSWSNIGGGDPVNSLLWSGTLDHTFYLAWIWDFYQAVVTPDSVILTRLPFPQEVESLTRHPQQPWVYIGGAYHMGRYDETTGDTMTVGLPQGVTHVYKVAYGSDGLLVRAYQGLYRVSDDLSQWELLDNTVNTGPTRFFYTSPNGCVISDSNRIYISAAPDAAAPARAAPSLPTVSVFPNPTNGGLVVSCGSPARFVVFDLLGRAVKEATLERPGSVWLDLSRVPSGIYFLHTTELLRNRTNGPAVRITLVK
ncbi:MAG TPA: T9SS type A sorting domain-containing protein [bacterium]|jgi:hypothetical protein